MTFEDCFYWSYWYNGYEDDLDEIIEYLKKKKNSGSSIFRPDTIKSDGSTPLLELFWMILVVQYGEYGTSPRSGWITNDKIGECIDHLENKRKDIWGELDY